jgi:hypothetical protein
MEQECYQEGNEMEQVSKLEQLLLKTNKVASKILKKELLLKNQEVELQQRKGESDQLDQKMREWEMDSKDFSG